MASKKWNLEIHPVVFNVSAFLAIVIVLLGALAPESFNTYAQTLNTYIVNHFGWFYVASVTGILTFVLWLMLSRFGKIRLGKDDSKPDYSFKAWFCMLFSAGMGIGLLYYGIGEPVMHYFTPPPESFQAATTAKLAEDKRVENAEKNAAIALEEALAAQKAAEVTPKNEEVVKKAAKAIKNSDQAEKKVENAKKNAIASEKAQRAQHAMKYTFFHWGLHAWGIYALAGLCLAYFAFRKDLPLTIRSAFYPLLGEKIHGPIGNTIDILAVLGTLFGVATSLGLGAMQINAGLDHLWGYEKTATMQIMLIAIITAMATTSVVMGLDKGILKLSAFNMIVAFLLMLFIFVFSPVRILNSFVQNVGTYVQALPQMSFNTGGHSPETAKWLGGWTIFYWGWWIAWAPFVGMFIARISRGRTIREFIAGVLFVPTILTFLWMTVFGDTALQMQMQGEGIGKINNSNDLSVSLFLFLAKFPWSGFMAVFGIMIITTFFVTSSDSGSFVIDIITSGGNLDPPVAQRIFWAVLEGVVAAILLYSASEIGLKALQTAAIAMGLPFCLVLVIMCYSLLKALRMEEQAQSD